MFGVGGWMFRLAILLSMAALPLHGQTGTPGTNAIPALLPPYDEMPPTFWERCGIWVLVTVLGVVALGVLGMWLYFRPKPHAILPPEVQARLALEALRQRPEDADCLGTVSQILRKYFIGAFELPPGELTTAEFCRALSSHDQIAAELSSAVADFLRRCDERKFSLMVAAAPLGAVIRGLELVALGEARRAQLRPLAPIRTHDPTSTRG
jgi:hypothetical protein